MKIYLIFILTLLATTGYAAEIYKAINEEGNIIFSDKPIPNTKQKQKIEVPEPSKQQEQDAQQKLKQLKTEDQTLRHQFDEKQKKLEAVQHKIKQAAAELDVASKAMQKAYDEWQQAANLMRNNSTPSQRKHVLQLAHRYERARAIHVQAQRKLASAQSKLNSLR